MRAIKATCCQHDLCASLIEERLNCPIRAFGLDKNYVILVMCTYTVSALFVLYSLFAAVSQFMSFILQSSVLTTLRSLRLMDADKIL